MSDLMAQYEIHEHALVIPVMNELDYESLRDDIQENGLNNPITLYEGKILDGRHRYQACRELGITPETEDYEGENPLTFVISQNLKRRHLDASQRTMIVLDMEEEALAEARKRQSAAGKKHGRGMDSSSPGGEKLSRNGAGGSGPRVHASEMMGKVADVSPRTVQRGQRLKRARPDLVEPVKKGEIKLNAADRIVKKDAAEREVPTKPPKLLDLEGKPRNVLVSKNALTEFDLKVIGLSNLLEYAEWVPLHKVMATATQEDIKQWIKNLDDAIGGIRKLRNRVKEYAK